MHICCLQIWHHLSKERIKNAYRQALIALRDRAEEISIEIN